ncbi:hypothetical protein BVX99_01920, partial [bacterium F16]
AMEIILCHNCLAENHPEACFCEKCNTPLSAYAAYDPLMQISAAGDTYCKATSGKPSWIKTLGILLIFGPLSLTWLVALYATVGDVPGSLPTLIKEPWWKWLPSLIEYGLVCILAIVPMLIILKAVFRSIGYKNPSQE